MKLKYFTSFYIYVIIKTENHFQIGDVMSERKYKTNSKICIMKYIRKINNTFTAQQLYNEIINNNEHIGLTTIYRFLDELTNNKVLKKFYDDNNVANYQYLEKCDKYNHFYLKCTNCGDLMHIDCDCILELQEHIYLKHKFKTNSKNIIIDGLCEKCVGGK